MRGISVTARANGAENSTVMTLRNARAKFYTGDIRPTFDSIGAEAEIISDELYMFDMNQVVSETNEDFENGKKWASNVGNPKDFFKYYTETDHIYALRSAPSGEKTLSRKMEALCNGESLEIKFDLFVPGPMFGFSSDSTFDVRLEGEGGSISRSLVKFNTLSTALSMLSDYNGVYANKVTIPGSVLREGFNKNNLQVVCKLTPNSTGGYDANITVTNYKSEKYTASAKDILTADEFESLDTFVVATATLGAGTGYGKGIAGIKNIIVTKTGTESVYDGGAIVINEGKSVGIKFQNPTKRPFDAKLMLVRYIGEKFSSVTVMDADDRTDATGYLTVPVTRENPEEDRFRIMFLEGNNMRPIRKADEVLIVE